MGFFTEIKKRFSNSPEWKGTRFEERVENMFDKKWFDIVEKTHGWEENEKRFVESSMRPDFTFRYRPTGEIFAVECKYRSRLYDGMLNWSQSFQLERYKQFSAESRIPVFIVIGLGGDDDDPDELFVIPLDKIGYPSLYPSVFRKYKKIGENFFWKNGKLS